MHRKTILLLTLLGTYAIQAAPAQSSSVAQQLENAEKEGGYEMLCSVAARFGRGLKYLSQSQGLINKDKLQKKCGNYFLGKNDDRKQHPQAYAAIMNYEGKDANDIDTYAEKAAKDKGIKHEPNPVRIISATPAYTGIYGAPRTSGF